MENIENKNPYVRRFGQSLRIARKDFSQSEWGSAAGIDPSVLSRIEVGKQGLPDRQILVNWMRKWSLSAEERDNMMMDAGYLPELEEDLLTEVDRTIIKAAIRELLSPNAPTGFIDIAKQRLDFLRNKPH